MSTYQILNSFLIYHRLDSGPHPREHKTGDYFWSKKKITMTKDEIIVGVNTFGWDLIAVHGNYLLTPHLFTSNIALFIPEVY